MRGLHVLAATVTMIGGGSAGCPSPNLSPVRAGGGRNRRMPDRAGTADQASVRLPQA
jgi:hypothetical protein